MSYANYFGGWFGSRAYGVVYSDEPLTKDEINEYLRDNLYDIEWDYDHKGEITEAEFYESEYVGE